jgi:hypothetical protein
MTAADSAAGEGASAVGEAATAVVVAVDEGVAVGSAVAVAVAVGVLVGVGVAVGVLVGSLVGDGVTVGDDVGVGVGDSVGDAVGAAVVVAVADGDGVCEACNCIPTNGEGLAIAGEDADATSGVGLPARAVGDAGGFAIGLAGSSGVAVDMVTGVAGGCSVAIGDGSLKVGGNVTTVAGWGGPLSAPGEATSEPANSGPGDACVMVVAMTTGDAGVPAVSVAVTVPGEA